MLTPLLTGGWGCCGEGGGELMRGVGCRRGVRMLSFDGDADRIVYHYFDDGGETCQETRRHFAGLAHR
jgi:hypothetical protein